MRTPWGDLAVHDAHVHFFSHSFFLSLVKDATELPATAAKLGWTLPGTEPARENWHALE